jgi:alpha-beta hydrolase superfamily lysophospholipase
VSTVRSKDGTSIAFDRHGGGAPVILVGGAFQHRAFDPGTVRLAEVPAEAGLSVVHYDRRGRGESGDTGPYAVERELEDLDALLDSSGGSAALYGSSSGGNLALDAAIRDAPITRLAVWEPNYSSTTAVRPCQRTMWHTSTSSLPRTGATRRSSTS